MEVPARQAQRILAHLPPPLSESRAANLSGRGQTRPQEQEALASWHVQGVKTSHIITFTTKWTLASVPST